MNKDLTISVPVKIDFPVQIPFRDILVKMVDYVRDPINGFSEESIDMAVKGLDDVIKATKEKTGNRVIKGRGLI